MKGKILRKLLILIIMIAPAFTVTDCRKQPDCGCDGDVIQTLDRFQANVYFSETGSSVWFNPVGNPYSTYYFCNPGEMFAKLQDSKPGDILLISGEAYWDCNFLLQSSNYSYYSSMWKTYQVQVTNVYSDLYGKGKVTPAE